MLLRSKHPERPATPRTMFSDDEHERFEAFCDNDNEVMRDTSSSGKLSLLKIVVLSAVALAFCVSAVQLLVAAFG
jgi:hypothetical protein